MRTSSTASLATATAGASAGSVLGHLSPAEHEAEKVDQPETAQAAEAMSVTPDQGHRVDHAGLRSLDCGEPSEHARRSSPTIIEVCATDVAPPASLAHPVDLGAEAECVIGEGYTPRAVGATTIATIAAAQRKQRSGRLSPPKATIWSCGSERWRPTSPLLRSTPRCVPRFR